ncbi:DNA mismatch repair protein MSH6 [Euphorbia lathyris]|uniref:DNA mismatch repair protein MSH6 n=1 Tax=Euphorbia lathyris TaxID=212925 RepID=UPI003313D691
MAPPRKQNGRSPIVNPQRQITCFFTKANSSSPSPASTLSKGKTLKSNPNPKSLSPSPPTPPLESKVRKPLLVIGQTPSPSPSPSTPATTASSYGREVVEKRIRVYWPLDKSWYDGCVKSFNEDSGKHLVQYDDFEEEVLDLGKEKIEWVEESVKKFKRLRRGSLAFKKTVIEDEEMKDVACTEEDSGGDDDDSSDNDWEKNVQKDISEEEEEDIDLVDEKDEDNPECEEKEKQCGKKKLRKRKACEAGKLGSGKKSKSCGDVNEGLSNIPVLEPKKNERNELTNGLGTALMGDCSERFCARTAEKLWFLGEEQRDAKRRRPGDEGYDSRTLYLPSDFVKSLSGGQRQWWEFKSKHMDKVLFFKMGKFYELFEMDAHVGAKELDLQYMKGEQPHCGFPEKNFSMNVEKLARKGYRVLVIEQTETPEQLELRNRHKKSSDKDKVVKREICAVVTKGTLTEGELLTANPDASYLMSLTENCQNSGRSFGICVVDAATSRIILGQFADDAECSSLCSLLSEMRPVEIIKPANTLSSEAERVLLRHTRSPLVNELLPLSEFWDAEKTVCELKTSYKHMNNQSTSGSSNKMDAYGTNSHVEEGSSCMPEILSELVNKGENGSLALSALGGALYYLKQAFLDETILRVAQFESLPCSNFFDFEQKPYMILDASAMENLEIFENSRNGGSSGTLYAQLNHCVTSFGKRLLKTWLARPLYHLKSIKDRQDAVAGLRGINQHIALEFRKTLSRLPDMERLLARIFAISEANGRNSNKVILYEDAAKKQLQEFISALRGCEVMVQACSSLAVVLENVESQQLHHLLTPGESLPDIHSILKHFKDAFDWVEANSSGRVIPHEGVDMDYDSACKKVKEIESNLTKHLKEQRKLLGDTSLSYVTVGKDAYLLEVPEDLQGSITRDYELRSSKKGYKRYWTPSIKKFLGELSQAESEKESALKSILQTLIVSFCNHNDKWRKLVSATAELDVLISLAIASEFYEGRSCGPAIQGLSSTQVPYLSAKNLGHPVLSSDSLGKGAFVPNDINIGGSSGSSFLLLTGPNMGGKSTLLRQVCLAVILAQIGADVPAESFELSPVDRIFVRMGARDHIMAGQSTFLTELSETALMLSSATRNSLVALDELGRGTSTSDGQAIAESVLEHFVHKVQCRGMFSTHYHRLAIDYNQDPKVSLCHMACQVGSRVGEVEEVTFLYRLTPGACPKSYGVNVARLAGLPESILQKAAAKSREFESIYGKKRKSKGKSRGNEMAAFIKNMIVVARSSSGYGSVDSSISSLTKLQQRASLLLQQT